MNKQTNWFSKVRFILLLAVGTITLGITFGVGGVIFASAIGVALALMKKLKHTKSATMVIDYEDTNPATGSPMMPGGLVDARSNPWGMRNRD